MVTDSPNIAQIVADGRPGGGTTMVLGLIDDLRAAGRGRITVVSQSGSYIAEQVRQRGLPFIGFNFFTSLADLSLPWRLGRRLGENRFDLTHVHGLRAAHTAVRVPARGHLGRLIYTVHGLHQLYQPLWLRMLGNLAERQIMRRVDERIFVSKTDAQLARQWRLLPPRARQQVVYNGVDVISMGALQRVSRDIDVLYLGRHVQQKAPDLAARVLAPLAAQGRRCVLAGDGPMHAACVQLLRALPGGQAVELEPELPRDRALALVARARVLVMPSRWEGLPILPIEAAALGVPVVASNLQGIAEVVENGVTGLLTPADDVAEMIKAALQLLDTPALWQAFRTAGLDRAARCFSRASNSAAYLQRYDFLLREST